MPHGVGGSLRSSTCVRRLTYVTMETSARRFENSIGDMMTEYVIKGTTDDVTTCGLCGREDLKKTIVLRTLDADGNEEDQTYFGSECATKVTGQRLARVKALADSADYEREQDRKNAREMLAYYDPDLPLWWLAVMYEKANPRPERYLQPHQDIRHYVLTRIAHWEAVLAA